MEWIAIVSPFICLVFVCWVYRYFKNCYINKLINELQELNEIMLEAVDTMYEFIERTR